MEIQAERGLQLNFCVKGGRGTPQCVLYYVSCTADIHTVCTQMDITERARGKVGAARKFSAPVNRATL